MATISRASRNRAPNKAAKPTPPRPSTATLAPLGSALERVILTPRFAWQLRLESGLNVELGRDLANDPAQTRLARFVAAYPHTLGRIARRHEYVDLRYPNGFALRVPDLARPTAAKAKG